MLEKALVELASITSPKFLNPRATESPAANDSSTKIATTAQVRAFVGQYLFPPKNVKHLNAQALDNAIAIQWGDSPDFSYDNMLLSQWGGTKVVYRTDRYPTSETDGTLVVDNQFRDWYAANGYLLDGLEDGITYYFQAFPYSSKDIYNRHSANPATAKPHAMISLEPLSDTNKRGRGWLAGATDGAGNVLFEGGLGDGYTFSVVTKYDLSGNRTYLANLDYTTYGLAAATDGNGKVVFGGGTGGNLSMSMILREIKTNTRLYPRVGINHPRPATVMGMSYSLADQQQFI